ncbi:hypothetical protein IKE86_00915 [Candidatus Saccharibacteria bacterium]|nr:hypothetical protein [Candidatus Saccharibacteria bacterium]
MKANRKLGKIKETIIFGRLLRGSLTATAVFVMAFVFMPYILAEANAANRVDADIRWSAIDLTFDPDVEATNDALVTAAEAAGKTGGKTIEQMTDEERQAAIAQLTDEERQTVISTTLADSTHGDVDFGTIVPTAKLNGNYGTMVVKKKTIGVTTRGKYYAVYLSMLNNDVTAGDGSASALTYEGASDTTMKISSTSGTWDAPKTVIENGNSGWGYMVPGTAVKKSDGTTTSAFGGLTRTSVATTFEGLLDQSIYSTNGAAYTSSIWAGVPAKSAPQQIWKGLNSAGYSSQDTFDVYYAINVDNDVMAGSYENQIVYTALASAESLDSVSNNLTRNVKFGMTGTVQTIYFDLAQTAANIVNGDTVKVHLVPHDVMAAANYDISQLSATDKQTYSGDAYECEVDPSSFTTVTTQQAVTEGSLSSIQCEMPVAQEAQEYDYWLEVTGYGFNYASKIDNGNEPAFVYAGLQTKRSNGTFYVTTMQDISSGVCSNTNIWKDGLGSEAKLYNPDGTTEIKTVAEGGQLPNNYATATTADGIGTFALRDTRDGKRYTVRRLADGNCWMVQNLNLDLYSGMTLTASDTDLNSRDSWTLAVDAEKTNDEITNNMTAEGSRTWIADTGSASKAWQTAHGVETVTLKQYTYTEPTGGTTPGEGEGEEIDSNWSELTLAECTGGTAQRPCFATATSVAYNKVIATQADVDANRATAVGEIMTTPVSVTAAVALADGYKTDDTTGSPVRGFAAGAYYATVAYQVRKLNAPNLTTSGNAYSSENIGSTCTYSYYNDHLKEGTACVIETSGEPMITQFSNDGTSVGMDSTEIPRLAISKDHLGNTIDFMNNTSTSTAFEYSDATYTLFPMSTTGADYRWARNGRDGAHVMDTGPMYFNVSYTEEETTVDEETKTYYRVTAGNGNARCANFGTVQGTLTDPATGNPYNFVSCMDAEDNTLAMADTRTDGNWYNWYAAVAGSTHPSNGATSRAADSICPKGWKLPSNNGDQDFYGLIDGGYSIGNNTRGNQATNTLTSNATDAKIRVFPLSFLRSGYYFWNSGGLNTRGSYGYYWSAGSASATNSYGLSFYSTLLHPRSSNYKGYGFAVRCVAAAE